MRYNVEIMCDSTAVEHIKAVSEIDAISIASQYLVRGNAYQNAYSNKWIARELPRAIAARGFACFEAGAVVVTIDPVQ